MTGLTRKQKNALARLVMDAIGNLTEYEPGQLTAGECDDASPEDIIRQLAMWASRLPSDIWDMRLGDPR